MAAKGPKREIVRIAVDTIELDRENPRLATSSKMSETELLRYLNEEESLRELAISLARNGYFEEEPIVIVPAKRSSAADYTVVEGNRRVATIKLLLSKTLRLQVGIEDWPRLSSIRTASLATVPSVIYSSREEVLPYLGFRHITGVRKWGNFARARYVSQLIDAGQDLVQLQESIGDDANAVKRLYQSFVVYSQYIHEFGEHESFRENFSLLEVALGQSSIKSFLGMPRALPTSSVKNIIPRAKLKALREIVVWIFGDPETGAGRILSDSRAISEKLAKVVSSDQALKYLRNEGILDDAIEYTDGELRYLQTQLRRAENATKRALGIIPIYNTDDEVKESVNRLRVLVASLTEHVA